MTETLRIATRGSRLALWQAEHVRARMLAAHPALAVELVVIKTEGDRILDRPLAEIGGKGLFVKEVEDALLDGRADLAVHSMKDMPAEQPPGLALTIVPERGPAFDLLCFREPGMSLGALPTGARVGTASVRRGAQLLALRPDVVPVMIRGNVETRLRKRFDPELGLDAVVLAEAGLHRLALVEGGFERLAPPDFLPAPAQGTLGIETRVGDEATLSRLRHLDDDAAWLTAEAERGCMAAVGGDCRTPFAAWARRDGDRLLLTARLMDADGRTTEGHAEAHLADAPRDQARRLGAALGADLLARHGTPSMHRA